MTCSLCVRRNGVIKPGTGSVVPEYITHLAHAHTVRLVVVIRLCFIACCGENKLLIVVRLYRLYK